MRRELKNDDDWDAGCHAGGCGCHGHCGGDSDDDREYDGGEPEDWGDDDATVPCPYCGKEIYEDSPRCPHCGRYISKEDAPPRRMPWGVILGVILCFCVIAVWIIAF
jgi:hypothetical protein